MKFYNKIHVVGQSDSDLRIDGVVHMTGLSSLNDSTCISINPAGKLGLKEITLGNLGGTVPVTGGGTGLSTMGSALQLLRVNAAGDAVEWYTPGASGLDWTVSQTDNIHVDNYSNTQLSQEEVEDFAGAMFDSNTTTGPISSTYNDETGKVDLTSTALPIAGGTMTGALEISSSSITDYLKLTTSGSDANPVKLIFEKTGSEQGVIEYNRNGDLEIYNTDSDGGVMISGSASADPDVYVNHAGNVGIGTNSPGQKITLNEGYINVTGAGTSHGYMLSRDSLDTYRIRHLDGGLTIQNSTDDRKEMTFDGAGNVGIGTTAPTEKLTVSGNISATGDVYANNINLTDSGGGNMIILDSSSGDGIIRWEDNNTQKWDFGRDNTDNALVISNEGGLNDNQVLHLDHSTGNATFGGNATVSNLISNGYVRLGADNKLISDGSITIDIDYNNNQTDRTFKVRKDQATDLFTINEDASAIFAGSLAVSGDISRDDGDLNIINKQNNGDIVLKADDGEGGQKTYLSIKGQEEFIHIPDDVKLVFGDRTSPGLVGDLYIGHLAGASYIVDQGAGDLNIRATNLALQSSAGENFLYGSANGSVEILHDGTKKFETTSGGIDVAGNIVVSGTVDSRNIATDGEKLDGIDEGANNYTLPEASSSAIGGIKVSSSVTNVVPNEETATSGRGYSIQKNSNGVASVNVPWTDNNTTYTLSAENGPTADKEIIRLSDNGEGTNDITLEAGDGLTIGRTGNTIKFDSTSTIVDATDETKGKVELATVSEAQTGTDTSRATTPAGVKAHVDQKYSIQYINIHGQAIVGADEADTWFFPKDVGGIEYFKFEDDSDAVSVESTSFTLPRGSQHKGIHIPYDCRLVGYTAIASSSGNNQSKSALWYYQPRYGEGGSTGTSCVRSHYAAADLSISSGNGQEWETTTNYTTRPAFMNAKGGSTANTNDEIALSAGHALLPSITGAAAGTFRVTFTIILKVPLKTAE